MTQDSRPGRSPVRPARGRGARGADFGRGRGARGAGQRLRAPLPTLAAIAALPPVCASAAAVAAAVARNRRRRHHPDHVGRDGRVGHRLDVAVGGAALGGLAVSRSAAPLRSAATERPDPDGAPQAPPCRPRRVTWTENEARGGRHELQVDILAARCTVPGTS